MSNRKTSRSTPVLVVDYLEYKEVTPIGTIYNKIRFGSSEWIEWLQRGETWSYDGKFTCRCEMRRNTYYWYAFKRDEVSGKLAKEYLGKAEQITKDKLLGTW